MELFVKENIQYKIKILEKNQVGLEGVNEPVTGAVNEPVTGAVNEPVTGAVNEPVAGAVIEPVTGAVNKPVTGAVIEPVTGAVNEPVTGAVNEPVAGAVNEPVTGAVIEPVAGTVNEPVTGAVNEPLSDPSNFLQQNINNNFKIIKAYTEDINLYNLIYKKEQQLDVPTLDVPIVIFIVPYRDRETEKDIFNEKMTNIMENYPNGYYKIFYIQQNFEKPFNRGAMKNIGFLMVKNKYPNNYKNITIVFNDIDTTPVNKETIPDYSTSRGIVKHFYGYNFVLGGIVSILAGDFEIINGFPNYYSWGFEDNELNDRVKEKGFIIDRSVFYHISDNINILQIKQSHIRVVNSGEFDRFIRKVREGINTIHNLIYVIDETTGIVDVKNFQTTHNVNESLNKDFNTLKGSIPFRTGYSARKKCRMNLVL